MRNTENANGKISERHLVSGTTANPSAAGNVFVVIDEGTRHETDDLVERQHNGKNQHDPSVGDKSSAVVVALSPGTITAIRGMTIVGFTAGSNPFGPSCERPRASYVVEWSGDKGLRT